MLFDELRVIGYSPPQLVPAKKMDAEQTLRFVALGYCIDMRLELGGVKRRRRNCKFRQGRRELERFGYFNVNVRCGELHHGPLAFPLALHAYDCTVQQSPAYIDAVLALAQESVSNGVVVVPNPAEEIGANVLEFIPALGNRQFG